EAPAQRAERIQFLALDELRRHRRIEIDNGRIADRAGADIARRCALPRHLDVAFEASHPIARLPIVAGLHAADDASEAVRGAGGEQRSAEHRVAADAVGLRLAGAVAEPY